MSTPVVSSALSYTELRRIVEDYGGPFKSLEQVETFLKAAWILRGREPSETEEDGTRVSKRDLLDQIKVAESYRDSCLVTAGRATVIVPGCL
ncbi:MAG: hypothetical protein AB7G28_22740 [Pirellulales bacterium]